VGGADPRERGYRVLYEIRDVHVLVLVIRVAQRRDAYR
jgi:mRNA-degrading endonuclease RelE of RelBE toxin-antitoxin system